MEQTKGIKIGSPYQSYYYLTEDNKVYNALTKRYLRANKNIYTLVNEDNKRVKATLKEIYLMVHNKPFCKDNIENLQGEQWKEIEGSSGNYFISNHGRIKSYKGYNAKLLSLVTTDKGYKRVNVNFGNGNYNYFVHRLVAEYFLPIPSNSFYDVHHKDFNTINNKVDNLMWVTKDQHKTIHREHERELAHERQSTK